MMAISSAEEFVRLRRSEVPMEYRRAANEEAPLAVWRAVIGAYPDMREWVAHNKTVPVSILEMLASDPDARVRQAVAMKRNLTRELFDALAADEDVAVRAQVASNAKAPAEVLAKLATDGDAFVAARALEKLATRDRET